MAFAKNKNAVSDAKMKEMEKAIRDFKFGIEFPTTKKRGSKFTTDSKGNTTKNYRFGGKVQRMRRGGVVNTTRSIQLSPITGEPI